MTAANHTATGMLILALVPNPLMLPVAFMSHFVLDHILHYGMNSHLTKRFITILLIDMSIAAALLLVVLLYRPAHWPLIIAGGILAASPDLMWLTPFVNELRHVKNKPRGLFRRFHGRVQNERSWGMVTEVPWFIATISLLALARVW